MNNIPAISFRKIEERDSAPLAAIIRSIMSEFDADPRTTIIGDPRLETMFQNYQTPRSIYFVVEFEGKLVGGCGINQLEGTEENICELQRMFLLPEARGKGIGKKLMEICLDEAGNMQYDKMYLETLSDMHDAKRLYDQSGFYSIPPLGSTGHTGCSVTMIKDLS